MRRGGSGKIVLDWIGGWTSPWAPFSGGPQQRQGLAGQFSGGRAAAKSQHIT